jgi:rod shape-determining protein MreD
MSIPVITLLLLAGATVQSLLPSWALIGSLEWPVLTALLITITLRASRSRLMYAALLAGLLYDSFSPAPLGSSMPFFLLLGGGLYALRDELFADQVVSYIVLGLLAVLLKTVYFAAVYSGGGLRPLQPGLLTVRLVGGFLLGALTAPLGYLAVSALRHALPEKTRRSW